MEKVRPWCGQPSDRGRLKNRTEPGGRSQCFREGEESGGEGANVRGHDDINGVLLTKT